MVSIVGSIGSVGLVIPHAMRFIVGVRHRRLVPASALAGAVFLIVSDIISRVIIPARCCPSASSPPWSERPLSPRSEQHTSELQSLMRISYAVFCLKKKKHKQT